MNRNLVFAGVFLVISIAMGLNAYFGMKVGTMRVMGPGFFPVMLSVLLGFLSILVGLSALPADAPKIKFARPRSIVLVIIAPLIFAATIRWLGLVLAVFLTTFVVSFASRHSTIVRSLVLAVGFTVFCVLLFSYLLNLPIALWGDAFIN
jgi:hypothetical protein